MRKHQSSIGPLNSLENLPQGEIPDLVCQQVQFFIRKFLLRRDQGA